MGQVGFKKAETGGTALHDRPRSGHTCTAVKPPNILWVMH